MKHLRNDPALKQRRQDLRMNQTEAERTLWKHLRDKQVHGLKFFRQYSIGPYIVDFYCPQLKLAIELDGGQHNGDSAREYDEARSAYLQAQGIEVMRFWNHDVLNQTKSVLRKVFDKA
jgi:very-short-patch-repair endonuclease